MNTTFSTPTSRYRSVKYRTSNAQSVTTATYKSKFTYFRSNHQSVTTKNKRKLMATLEKSQPNIRIYNQEECEQPKKSLAEMQYIDLVSIALKSQDKRQSKSIQKSSVQLKQLKQKQNNLRVHLPNLTDYYSQHCTLLDPIRLPIKHIQEAIYKLNNEIKNQSISLKMIRSTIPMFQQNQIKKLQQIEEEGIESIKRFSKMLKTHKVFQQQQVLKMKKNIKQLQDFIPPFKQSFQKSHNQLISLQTTIFDCKPFQLEQKEEFKISQNQYF